MTQAIALRLIWAIALKLPGGAWKSGVSTDLHPTEISSPGGKMVALEGGHFVVIRH